MRTLPAQVKQIQNLLPWALCRECGFVQLVQAVKEGFPGVEVAACGNARSEDGFSIKTFYNVTPEGTWTNNFSETPLERHPYKDIIESNIKAWQKASELPLIPLVCQGWDRRPWEAPNGEGLGKGGYRSWYFDKGSPGEFKGLLEKLADWMDANPKLITKDRLAIIYAWNEIGEGGWLVPCKDDPEGAYLKAIKKVVLGK